MNDHPISRLGNVSGALDGQQRLALSTGISIIARLRHMIVGTANTIGE